MGRKGVATPDPIREFIVSTDRNAPKLKNPQIVDKVVAEFGEEARLDKSTVGRLRKLRAGLELSDSGSTVTAAIEHWPTPKLVVSLEGLDRVISNATILPLDGIRPIGQAAQSVWVRAYRIRVDNNGGGGAEHVAGTLEINGRDRRICWVEGNVPYIDINAYDHAYLDVYGVILDPQYNPTSYIVMPTEHGWDGLLSAMLTEPLVVTLTVTAANGLPTTTSFCIDPGHGCEPIPGRLSERV